MCDGMMFLTVKSLLRFIFLALITVILQLSSTSVVFSFVISSTSSVSLSSRPASSIHAAADSFNSPTLNTNQAVKRVAVSGATGRVGQLVVQELLNRKVEHVVGVVRDVKKADSIFPKNTRPPNLEIVTCDLANEKEIATVLRGSDAAIWCATGFIDDFAGSDPIEMMKRLFGMAPTPKRSIDYVGVSAFARCLLEQQQKQQSPAKSSNIGALPKLVMLSSAGVTRPAWDAASKRRWAGAAEIPIVRLNPAGVLDSKRHSEEALRETGLDYCIFRPCGLNDKHPPGSRVVLSQGDVAVGRIHRQDVATLLVDVLTAPEATGKTFEAVGLSNYPPPASIRPALSRLVRDQDGPLPREVVDATYTVLQQLLPGEQQDSAGIALGQTYEQLDKGEVGRFGKRGQEVDFIRNAAAATNNSENK